ncbi:MAG: hypothetical protein LBK60_08955 [Verrucomicrobiales bacterium]|nr:hypothetical protein [Verrucomicrobiales bacterium]
MTVSGQLGELCHGRGDGLRDFLQRGGNRWLALTVGVATLGSFAYGLGMGGARSLTMGWMVGVKLPLVIFLTLMVNAVLNGLLAGALGSGLGFRQTLRLLVLPFGLMGTILLGLAPVAWFIAWHAPAAAGDDYKIWHPAFLLMHTFCVALAGIWAHRQILPLARTLTVTPARGTLVFLAWLAGNLFVGAQLTWIFRPYFCSPGLPVQFLRDHPLEGNFYETVLHSIKALF